MRRVSWQTRLKAKLTEPPPPIVPFSEEYGTRHQRFVADALDSGEIMHLFRRGQKLPRGYGLGMDERVVEYPWLLAQRPAGKVLDAGSTLNHAYILERFVPTFQTLHIVTLAPELESFPQRGVSYLYADLRDLPFRDGYYDTIVSISTLEHVGKDNARYGAQSRADGDPHGALLQAVSELKRVLAPGGLLLVTVPYGVAEDYGWLVQFDQKAFDDLIRAFDPREFSVTVFAYSRHGWQRSSLVAAAGARYRDSTFENEPAEDLAVAARAVACLRATL